MRSAERVFAGYVHGVVVGLGDRLVPSSSPQVLVGGDLSGDLYRTLNALLPGHGYRGQRRETLGGLLAEGLAGSLASPFVDQLEVTEIVRERGEEVLQ